MSCSGTDGGGDDGGGGMPFPDGNPKVTIGGTTTTFPAAFPDAFPANDATDGNTNADGRIELPRGPEGRRNAENAEGAAVSSARSTNGRASNFR